jgi:solute carrier family 50 protein (sugar transporter)
MGLVHMVKTCASIAACYLLSSPLGDVKRIRENKATTGVQLLPLLSMFANSTCWFIYGILAHDIFPLMVTNGIGMGLTTFYLVVYYKYAPDRQRVFHQILFLLFGLFLIAMYPIFSYEPHRVVQQNIGYVSILVCAIMFGSPLVVLKEVIRQKSTDLLPLTMIVAGFINSLLWLLYGLILGDLFVIVPNLVNIFLGSIQLLLFCIFPKPTGGYRVLDSKV